MKITTKNEMLYLTCYYLSQQVIAGTIPDVTWGSLYFYNPKTIAEPSWKKEHTMKWKIGTGACVYETKEKAEKAYKAILAQGKFKKKNGS